MSLIGCDSNDSYRSDSCRRIYPKKIDQTYSKYDLDHFFRLKKRVEKMISILEKGVSYSKKDFLVCGSCTHAIPLRVAGGRYLESSCAFFKLIGVEDENFLNAPCWFKRLSMKSLSQIKEKLKLKKAEIIKSISENDLILN